MAEWLSMRYLSWTNMAHSAALKRSRYLWKLIPPTSIFNTVQDVKVIWSHHYRYMSEDKYGMAYIMSMIPLKGSSENCLEWPRMLLEILCASQAPEAVILNLNHLLVMLLTRNPEMEAIYHVHMRSHDKYSQWWKTSNRQGLICLLSWP